MLGARLHTTVRPLSRSRRKATAFFATALAASMVALLLATALEAGTIRDPSGRSAPSPFPVSTPEEQGMDSTLLAGAIDYLLSQRDLYNINSLTVIRHGRVVTDAYFYPYPPSELHDLASVSKVWLSTVVGIAIDQGYIASVNEPVISFFPDRTIANLDDRKRAMTIRHLLTMTSGLGDDDTIDGDAMEASADWAQFAIDLPMSAWPGTRWNYHQPTAYLLSAIVSERTGMNVWAFARKNLFRPLGIDESVWTANAQGVTRATEELKLTPTDLARFAQMILQNGIWNGEQIVPASWIGTATRPLIDDFYGYFWDARYPDFIYGGGALGQRMIISRDRDMVVVFTAHGYVYSDVETTYLGALRDYIFPAVKSDEPLPADPTGDAQLADAIERAAAPRHEPQPVEPLPAMASEISGQTYRLVVPDGSMSMRLTFLSGTEARLLVIATDELIKGSPFEWAAGLDGVERLSQGRYHIAAAGTGGWTDDRTFVMNVYGMGDRVDLRLTFVFDGNDVTVTIEDTYPFDTDDPLVFAGTRED